MLIIADSQRNLQENLECLYRKLKSINLRINVNKTKRMIISARDKRHDMSIEGQNIEQLSECK